MKIGDWVNIQGRINTSSGESINIYVAEIVHIEDNGIQIQWEREQTTSFQSRKCQAWIDKSSITYLTGDSMQRDNNEIKFHLIALPEWIKLDLLNV